MKNQKVRAITHSAIIASLYCLLTFVAYSFGLSSGSIQVRISEALTVLPAYTPYAIPGVTIGCLLSNILTSCAPMDIVFGTLATLLGAVLTYMLRKHKKLAPIPPILSNTIIVPLILTYVYGAKQALPFLMLTVGTGELLSAGVLGTLLMGILDKNKKIFNKQS